MSTPDAARLPVTELPLTERLKLRKVEAVEEFALAVIPRGTLRRRLLDWVDREFERIGHLVDSAE
jgi:hypothetical protein